MTVYGWYRSPYISAFWGLDSNSSFGIHFRHSGANLCSLGHFSNHKHLYLLVLRARVDGTYTILCNCRYPMNKWSSASSSIEGDALHISGVSTIADFRRWKLSLLSYGQRDGRAWIDTVVYAFSFAGARPARWVLCSNPHAHLDIGMRGLDPPCPFHHA